MQRLLLFRSISFVFFCKRFREEAQPKGKEGKGSIVYDVYAVSPGGGVGLGGKLARKNDWIGVKERCWREGHTDNSLNYDYFFFVFLFFSSFLGGNKRAVCNSSAKQISFLFLRFYFLRKIFLFHPPSPPSYSSGFLFRPRLRHYRWCSNFPPLLIRNLVHAEGEKAAFSTKIGYLYLFSNINISLFVAIVVVT